MENRLDRSLGHTLQFVCNVAVAVESKARCRMTKSGDDHLWSNIWGDRRTGRGVAQGMEGPRWQSGACDESRERPARRWRSAWIAARLPSSPARLSACSSTVALPLTSPIGF